MSNDLISRSAFVKEINEYMKNVYECDIESVSDFQDGNNSKESYIVQGLFEAFELIENVPTAYDVDKVVERLEKMKDISTHNIALNSQENDIDAEILREIKHYRRIIQIVKSGGIE